MTEPETSTKQPAVAGQQKMEALVRAGYMEELRFAKRQQWAVATAAIALIAGVYHLGDGIKPPLTAYEKLAVMLAILGVTAGGIWLVLFDIQNHIAST